MNKRLSKTTEILAVAGLAACAFLASEVAMPQTDAPVGFVKRLSTRPSTLPYFVEPASPRRKLEARLVDTATVEDSIAQIDACMTETMQEADIPGAALR